MGELDRPLSRSEYNRALITNAALDSFNVVVLAGMVVAGVLLGVFWLVLPVALVVYAIAVARTYFDEDAQQKVLARERAKRAERLGAGAPRVDPAALAPPIRALLDEAFAKAARIDGAIERAELPYAEVSREVDGFVRAIEQTASRAQLLHEALEDSPPERVERRLATLRRERDPAKRQLVEALEHQLAVGRRMRAQLGRFFTELERMLVELETVRGNLLSVSASTEAANQQRLAEEVRSLREEVGALSDGMSEAFEPPALPAS